MDRARVFKNISRCIQALNRATLGVHIICTTAEPRSSTTKG